MLVNILEITNFSRGLKSLKVSPDEKSLYIGSMEGHLQKLSIESGRVDLWVCVI